MGFLQRPTNIALRSCLNLENWVKQKDIDNKNANEQASGRRMTWSQRLARVFQIDITKCPHCSGEMKIIACIKEPQMIKKILNHLDIQAEDNPLFCKNTDNPRAPPEPEYDIWFD